MSFDPRIVEAASGTVGDEAQGLRVGARGETGSLCGASLVVPEGTPCALRVGAVGAALELDGDEAAAAARLALEAARSDAGADAARPRTAESGSATARLGSAAAEQGTSAGCAAESGSATARLGAAAAEQGTSAGCAAESGSATARLGAAAAEQGTSAGCAAEIERALAPPAGEAFVEAAVALSGGASASAPIACAPLRFTLSGAAARAVELRRFASAPRGERIDDALRRLAAASFLPAAEELLELPVGAGVAVRFDAGTSFALGAEAAAPSLVAALDLGDAPPPLRAALDAGLECAAGRRAELQFALLVARGPSGLRARLARREEAELSFAARFELSLSCRVGRPLALLLEEALAWRPAAEALAACGAWGAVAEAAAAGDWNGVAAGLGGRAADALARLLGVDDLLAALRKDGTLAPLLARLSEFAALHARLAPALRALWREILAEGGLDAGGPIGRALKQVARLEVGDATAALAVVEDAGPAAVAALEALSSRSFGAIVVDAPGDVAETLGAAAEAARRLLRFAAAAPDEAATLLRALEEKWGLAAALDRIARLGASGGLEEAARGALAPLLARLAGGALDGLTPAEKDALTQRAARWAALLKAPAAAEEKLRRALGRLDGRWEAGLAAVFARATARRAVVDLDVDPESPGARAVLAALLAGRIDELLAAPEADGVRIESSFAASREARRAAFSLALGHWLRAADETRRVRETRRVVAEGRGETRVVGGAARDAEGLDAPAGLDVAATCGMWLEGRKADDAPRWTWRLALALAREDRSDGAGLDGALRLLAALGFPDAGGATAGGGTRADLLFRENGDRADAGGAAAGGGTRLDLSLELDDGAARRFVGAARERALFDAAFVAAAARWFEAALWPASFNAAAAPGASRGAVLAALARAFGAELAADPQRPIAWPASLELAVPGGSRAIALERTDVERLEPPLRQAFRAGAWCRDALFDAAGALAADDVPAAEDAARAFAKGAGQLTTRAWPDPSLPLWLVAELCARRAPDAWGAARGRAVVSVRAADGGWRRVLALRRP